MLILLILLLLIFGGGGGWYGYNQWGAPGGLGIFIIVLILFLVFGLPRFR